MYFPRVGKSNYERFDWELDSLDNRINDNTLMRNGETFSRWTGYRTGVDMFYDINPFNNLTSSFSFGGRDKFSDDTTSITEIVNGNTDQYQSIINTNSTNNNIEWTIDYTKNFINAVISEKAFDKISKYIDYAKKSEDAEIIAGGNYDKSKGYFIEPTIILTNNPNFKTMVDEIFGPVITIFVYKKEEWEETLNLVDQTSEYALTGAIFSIDRHAIELATSILENAAGNFYINDKPTGAVVGQQPFGGSRGSGTNDKAGSILNLLRWISPRTIKETFVPAKDYKYPFLK